MSDDRLLRFMLFLIIAPFIVSSEKTIQCPQCVTGNFLSKQWLFQASEIGQSMGWVDQWSNTECRTGRFEMIECWSSCLTIIVEKDQRQNMGYKFDGMMMDCADELIHASPDLPQGVDYTSFKGDEVYSAIRMDHNITYKFSTQSAVNAEAAVRDVLLMNLPLTKIENFKDMDIFSQVIYGFGTVVLLIIALYLIYGIYIFLCKIPREHRPKSEKKIRTFFRKGDKDEVTVELNESGSAENIYTTAEDIETPSVPKNDQSEKKEELFDVEKKDEELYKTSQEAVPVNKDNKVTEHNEKKIPTVQAFLEGGTAV
uniref:Uncharacterized protein n=1 Tax=Caenorhabditis japonica TaxID=281687 RepID=A0A8R1DP17_CAEJA